MRHKLWFCSLLLPLMLLSGSYCYGQKSTKLDNAAVLKMKAAGLDDSTIIRAIETNPGEYDTSVDGLIALKSGGATEAVLNAILARTKALGVNPGGAVAPAPAPAAAAAASPYPDELGIYYLKQETYEPLAPEIMSIRTTNALATAYSYGIKAQKINGWITGKHGKTKIGSEVRTFFIKMPEGVAPSEYTLLRFKNKDDRREVELGRARFTVRMGVEHSSVPFEHEKLSKGNYRITVRDLKPGDYGFLPPGAEISKNSASAGKVYTFWMTE